MVSQFGGGWIKNVGTKLFLALLATCVRLVVCHAQIPAAPIDGRYEAESGEVSMVLTGDSLINRPLIPFREPDFLRLRDIMLGADVRFTNGETLFHNYEDSPTSITGVWERSDPAIVKDLQWLGINLMASANNHAYDFGENGVLTNLRYLNQSGMVHAGTGANYAEAVAPAYLETPKGRVALVAATTSGYVGSRAGEQRRDMKGRPGVNFIRWMNEWTVDKETFEVLKHVAREFKWEPGDDAVRAYLFDKSSSDNTINFFDRNLGMPATSKSIQYLDDPPARFILGTTFARHSVLHEADLKRNVKSVQDARRMADWVIYSVHNHEGGANNDVPSDHIVTLAHAIVDAGADVFVGHGPNITRGIEIYKGRPIFYGLGNLIRETQTSLLVPEEAMPFFGLGNENSPGDYFDAKDAADEGGTAAEGEKQRMRSVIALTKFRGRKLSSIELYPIDLGFGASRSQAGRPVLAHGHEAQEILERIQRLSEAFHTKIEIRGEIGIVRLDG